MKFHLWLLATASARKFKQMIQHLDFRCFFIVFHKMHSKEVQPKTNSKTEKETQKRENKQSLFGFHVLRLILSSRWYGNYRQPIDIAGTFISKGIRFSNFFRRLSI